MVRKIIIALVIILIGIQFIRPARNNGNAETPTDITHYVHIPDTIMHMLKTSCYDCHSNHTKYPWYVNVNPVGLWLRQHINEGKRHLNFSDVSMYDKAKLDKKLKQVGDQVEKHEMPLGSYTLIHTDAKLNDNQVKMIKAWTDSARKEVGYQGTQKQ